MGQPNASSWAECFIEDHLEEPLLHGSEEHREWLSKELRKWIPEIADMLEEFRSETFRSLA
jgi:hypothetical protein